MQGIHWRPLLKRPAHWDVASTQAFDGAMPYAKVPTHEGNGLLRETRLDLP